MLGLTYSDFPTQEKGEEGWAQEVGVGDDSTKTYYLTTRSE
jgi:hypothetical protein